MSFAGAPEAYDSYMGRYSRQLAPLFAEAGRVARGQTVLDVGAGPGALTELLDRLGATVSAAEPSSTYAAACAERVPRADVRQGEAEHLPWADDTFDAVLAQLVVHFMADPGVGVAEMARVARPGGTVAACTWDSSGGMQLISLFWQAVEAAGLEVPEQAAGPAGTADELLALWCAAGLGEVEVLPLDVSVTYADLDDFWGPVAQGVGPTGDYCVRLSDHDQARVKAACDRLLPATLTLTARAWAVRGTTA